MNYKFETMSIGDLQKLNCTFVIPDYQRGYRWQKEQITELLEDINDFAKKTRAEGEKNVGFYCLQPIMLKKMETDIYEVIDGQQRLTSIMLVLNYLIEKNGDDQMTNFKLEYETRKASATQIGSAEFLTNIHNATKSEAEENIDYYHMYMNYQEIESFLGNLTKDDRNNFSSVFKQSVKIIWYEVSSNTIISSNEQFQNINARKIPLTNAELIKALLLNLDNFKRKSDDIEGNRDDQFYWSTLWDNIEKELHNQDLWFFLTSVDENKKIETRIDLVFDIVAQSYQKINKNLAKYNKKDINYSFKILYEMWNERSDKVSFAKEVLGKMKLVHQSFIEWYENDELFHYIGYITCFEKNAIQKIYNAQEGKTKKQIIDWLITEIRRIIGIKKIEEIRTLSYKGDQAKIEQILLLFNILSLTKLRFSFKEYKFPTKNGKKGWDLEHIHSQNDEVGDDERQEWLEMFINTCENMKDEQVIKLVQEAKTIIDNDNWDSYKELERKIIAFFSGGENNSEEGDNNEIENIAILNSDINRSYKNAIFPKKRSEIIKKDQEGVFIPVATKNVFLKYYSNDKTDLSKMFMWTKSDKADYLKAIESKIEEFIQDAKGVSQ